MSDESLEIVAALRTAILGALPDADVHVASGSPGHFSVEVISPAFAGKGRLESQRLVYAAIAPLMKGDRAPVHAIDSLRTASP